MNTDERNVSIAAMALEVEPDWLRKRLAGGDDDLLTVDEAASLAGIKKQTIYNRLSKGELQRHYGAGRLRISRRELFKDQNGAETK
jgi:excisionase family DNA binding protein